MVNLIPNHGFDGRKKIVGSEIAVFDLAELIFPLSGQQRGTERFGQNGNQISSFVGRQKLFDLFAPALDETAFDQLFNDARAGCRRADAFALGFVGEAVCTGAFHCSQKRCFGVALRRGRQSLFDNGAHPEETLMLIQRRINACLFIRLAGMSDAAVKCACRDAPAQRGIGFAGCRKDVSRTGKRQGALLGNVRLADRAQQTDGEHAEDVQFLIR